MDRGDRFIHLFSMGLTFLYKIEWTALNFCCSSIRRPSHLRHEYKVEAVQSRFRFWDRNRLVRHVDLILNIPDGKPQACG